MPERQIVSGNGSISSEHKTRHTPPESNTTLLQLPLQNTTTHLTFNTNPMKNLFFALRYSLKSLRGNISRVVSITLGLALGLLAFSFIVFDLSYNSFLPDKERVYQFWVHYDADGLKGNFDTTFGTVAPGPEGRLPAGRNRHQDFGAKAPCRSNRTNGDFEANLLVARYIVFRCARPRDHKR